MQNYTPPEVHILTLLAEGCLAASLENPVEGEEIPW